VDDEFWMILKSQPGVGILLIDTDGLVLFANDQARRMYYGDASFDPVNKTIEEIEGPEFAAERLKVLHEVLATRKPQIIRHIRGGKLTEATIWPLRRKPSHKPCILSITRQGIVPDAVEPFPVFDSRLIDLGPLDVLTRRELEVLALVGHGTPLKTIARELGVSQRTVERYRTDIARKLRVNSIAEIARIVQQAGLDLDHADLPRLQRWHQPKNAPPPDGLPAGAAVSLE
jgi:DNA-binding CsgD family transcriptional regulator